MRRMCTDAYCKEMECTDGICVSGKLNFKTIQGKSELAFTRSRRRRPRHHLTSGDIVAKHSSNLKK